MTTERQRKHMAALMDELVARKGRVHYAQVRPMQTRAILPGHLRRALRRRRGITMDCSESVTLICRLAGLRDPNGLDYNGTGFTGTLLGYLDHYVDVDRARTGALWVVGAGDGEHVCMVRKPDKLNPVLFSHGTELDPSYYTLHELLDAFHGKPWTFLSVAKLGIGRG